MKHTCRATTFNAATTTTGSLDSPDLPKPWLTNPHLRKLGVYIHENLGLTLCSICGYCVLNIRGHCVKNHKHELELNELHSLPISPLISTTDPRLVQFYSQIIHEQVPGIPLFRNGFKCSQCNRIYSKQKTLRQHPCLQFDSFEVPLFQSFYTDKNRKYFEVTSSISATSLPDPDLNQTNLQSLATGIANRSMVALLPGSMESKLKWESFFNESFSKISGRKLVTCDSDDTFLNTQKEKLFEYLKDVTNQVKNENRQYLLQQVDQSIKGLRALVSVNSVKVYASTMYSIFCFLYRVVIKGENHGGGSLDYVDVKFLEYWETPGALQFNNLLNSILFCNKGLLEKRNSFFLSKVLALLSVDINSQWKSCNVMRQPIAHLQYWRKCVVYRQTLESDSDNPLEKLDIKFNNTARILADYAAILKAHLGLGLGCLWVQKVLAFCCQLVKLSGALLRTFVSLLFL
jgi:hypothetical protein